MCGINGMMHGKPEATEKMSVATAHRGPDATGTYRDRQVTFAHNRLSVIDLSSEANQPMEDSDGQLVIVFNGEIYNFKALREKLTSWHFKTNGDTEVLLAAYREWGESMFEHIRGMYAFALWDKRKSALLLARDRLGIKPLFYAVQENALYFSSEIRALSAGIDSTNLDEAGVSRYVGLNYTPGPETLLTGIKKLRPGHFAWYRDGALSEKRYWTPVTPTRRSVDSEEVRSTLKDAIVAQLVSDREIGVFLSGGFDSTTVIHHATEAVQGLRTFTSRFELDGVDTTKYNVDAHRAEQTAKKYGTNHTTYTIKPSDIVKNFEAAILALDEPIANPTTVSQYLLSKWIRRDGVVVALGGDGGDELFGGYERHQIALAATYFQSFPQLLRNPLTRLSPKFEKLNKIHGPELHMQLMAQKEEAYEAVVSGLPVGDSVRELFATHYSEPHIARLHPLDRFMRVDRETWLVDESLSHTDAMSMVHGLEVRVPFLDETVIDLTDSICGTSKCSLRTGKKILREAYRGILPAYLYEGPKRGWFSPGAKWMREPKIHAFAKEVLSDTYYDGLSAHINWEKARKMYEAHVNGSYHLYPLWSLLVLQIWARDNKATF